MAAFAFAMYLLAFGVRYQAMTLPRGI